MQIETITREQVIEMVKAMPIEKLVRWYEFGLFIQSSPLLVPAAEDKQRLGPEFAAWEAASDEDWLKLESRLTEGA